MCALRRMSGKTTFASIGCLDECAAHQRCGLCGKSFHSPCFATLPRFKNLCASFVV